MVERFSSGWHPHVKEILGHWGFVSHKRGRDMQGQEHRPWSFEENSILWSVVVRPLLGEEANGVPRGGVGVFNPPPRNSEGPPKSYQTQPDL